ncbi:MAG: hypothetical protein OXG72_14165 [Acidobacteria bacterium]|nr:hypothetical protein [Acidobacteriota bacterium]
MGSVAARVPSHGAIRSSTAYVAFTAQHLGWGPGFRKTFDAPTRAAASSIARALGAMVWPGV